MNTFNSWKGPMGQYFIIVNVTKKQYIAPGAFGDGAKLVEFAPASFGTMSALALLLTNGNGQGLGDHPSESPFVGSWAGDKIIVAGDYGEPGRFMTAAQKRAAEKREEHECNRNLYTTAHASFRDISDDIITVLCEDDYMRHEMCKNTSWRKPEDLHPVLVAARVEVLHDTLEKL